MDSPMHSHPIAKESAELLDSFKAQTVFKNVPVRWCKLEHHRNGDFCFQVHREGSVVMVEIDFEGVEDTEGLIRVVYHALREAATFSRGLTNAARVGDIN
jgi:hypothetical protein